MIFELNGAIIKVSTLTNSVNSLTSNNNNNHNNEQIDSGKVKWFALAIPFTFLTQQILFL